MPTRFKTLVTGATSGIGRGTALHLAAQGHYVIAAGQNPARLADLSRALGRDGETLKLDVADLDAVATAFGGLGRQGDGLSGLVINAGVSHAPDPAELDLPAYDRLMNINVRGAVMTCAHALPLLRNGASIVFIGSVAGRRGQPGNALYAGSKGFIRAFARTLGTAPDIMERGIRVNVVSPGPIETPMTEHATNNPEIRAYVEGMVPMRRWGHASEVAAAVAFFLSDAASFTTGADLTVDGGMSHV
ncbi:SDR family oxidoreductase [Asaia sp. BMEF1]|uniref:SDR family NAD(P)-dependent oxidoreductase n=1 Tax=Asaia sp. BMEF1 TaxID=3155932 RepID=UPI003F6742F1